MDRVKRHSAFTSEELALAYELRQEGCCWKNIAKGLGCDSRSIWNAVYRAVRFGLTVAKD